MVEVVGARDRLRYPQDLCCNCGTTEGVETFSTELRQTVWVIVGGIERRATLRLPYCPACRDTAGVPPFGIGGMLIVWLLLGFAGMFAFVSVPALRALGVTGGLLLIGAAAATPIALWRFLAARPRGKQTTAFQPVALTWSGLRFSNRRYAERVVAVSPDAALIGGPHAFVRGAGVWLLLAAIFVTAVLLLQKLGP